MSVRVALYSDELYPYYGISEEDWFMTDDYMYEVDEETLARWRAVINDFFRVQHEMEQVIESEVVRMSRWYCDACRMEWRTFVGYFFHWARFGKEVR